MIRALVAGLLLPLTPAASDPLSGRIAGEPVRCIDASRANGADIMDGHTILYRDGARLYRTSIAACPALRPQSTLIVDVYGARFCRGDRFRVLVPGTTIPSADCRFGMFVPYTKVTGRTG